MTTNLIILLVLLVLSAFFSASEVAFVSLTNAKVETMVKRKVPRAKKIKKLKENPRRLLVAILIGNNIVNIASASLATMVASEMFQSAVLGITTGVMTLLILIFGEIIPKSYAANHNKSFAVLSSPILSVLVIIFWPFIVVLEWLANFFAGRQRPESISEEELKIMAHAGVKQGTIEKKERQMIERLFQFNDITAEDIMTPRVNMMYLEDTMTIEEAEDVIKSTPHTRFPVIKDTPDNIIGYVHSRDLLLAYIQDKENASIKNVVLPILRVPKQMRIDDLLQEFQKKQVHIALVQDELGGTEGITTLEDVLEELVGEITDEHDVEDDIIKRIDKNTIVVSGEEQLRDINDFLNVSIPGDPLDSIAEKLLEIIKKSPRKNMIVDLEKIKCTVVEVKNKVIKKVKIEKE